MNYTQTVNWVKLFGDAHLKLIVLITIWALVWFIVILYYRYVSRKEGKNGDR